MNVKTLVVLLLSMFSCSLIIAADNTPKAPTKPPREILTFDGPACFTGAEKIDKGKRIAEVILGNGLRLWLELATDAPLSPLCGN